MRYTLKHALMLALGLTLGVATMAFTDILNPITPYIPSSLVLSTERPLPDTMTWVDPYYGFETKNPTGVLEVRWYCVYEGLSDLNAADVDGFAPLVVIRKPDQPEDQDVEEFYYELTRVQNDPCPVFRFNHDYPTE